MERLHEGWLVKSPPGKKTIGPWRLFKSKWRQRFFVLYAPPSAQSIPGCCSAVLCYYDDDTMTKEYGRIDLNSCEEILTKLESDDHRFVFALRTINKDSERTYYLAAETEESMNEWANCLCCVLRLSGGDGITFSSGFGHLPSFADTAFSSNLPRCSILTQKTGEQRRLSNVPDTISKSASALNIRIADLTQAHATNSTTTTPNTTFKPKTTQHKFGKRQSILNMVIKPAANSARRPSCPVLPLNNDFQTKFQTLSYANMGAATRQLNAQSPDGGDLHNQNFTLGRPIPKFHLEPPTPAYNNDERWRFGVGGSRGGSDGGDDTAAAQQCPPALPSRVTRNASSVERRENFNVQNRYRNSMEEASIKSSWRDSDFQDDCDEDSRDPDYDLPRRNYDCGGEDADVNQTESIYTFQDEDADEDDRDDDYSYPHFHYTIEGGGSASSEAQFRSNPLTVVEETEGTFEDSYDYLPGYNRTSDRASNCRSSAQPSGGGNDSIFYDDRGIYDVPPIRDTSSIGTGSRMSGIEAGLDDSGCGAVYQNNDVFHRESSSDIYDLPQQMQNPSPLPVVAINNSEIYSNGILPPLPEKRATAAQTPLTKGDVENGVVVVEKRRVAPPPLPASQSVSQTEEHSYMNAGDVRMSGYSTCSSLDEGVYLPMTCGKASETIYTPMHSPDGSDVFKPVPSESSCDRSEEEARRSLDARELSQPQKSQSPANDHGPALIPIRFTANTRSFKRKTPSRGGSVTREDSLGSSAKHKENREPSPKSKVPPPLPPKTRLSKGSNYVHYASLDLESTSSGDRPPSHLSDPPTSPLSLSGSFQSDTLYRTIDLEKTKALCELKKQTEDDHRQRNFARLQSSEH